MKRFLIGGGSALVALVLLLGAASISYTEYQYNIDVATNLTVHGTSYTYNSIVTNALQVNTNLTVGNVWVAGAGTISMNYDSAAVNFGATSDATILRSAAGTLRVVTNLTADGSINAGTLLQSQSVSATNLVFQRTRVIRQALTHAGGTVTLNMATNVPGYSVLTLTGAVTFASSGLVDGSQYDLLFFSSGASNTITWGPEFRFPSFKPSYISATNAAGQATIARLYAEAYGTNLICTYAEEP